MMRKFILQTFLFIAVAVSIIFGSLILSSELVKKSASFKLSKNINNIVLGHSHPQCAFNPTYISGFRNLSDGGESYFYTYIKVVELLSQNKHIDNIFIEFSNNQIDEEMDEWVWGEKFISHRYHLYAPFMNSDAHQLLLRNNFSSVFKNYNVLLNNNLRVLNSGNFDYTQKIGGYHYLKEEVGEVQAAFERLPNQNESSNISQIQIHYLKKIIDVCTKGNVKVYLIRTPVHSSYSGLKNEVTFKDVLATKFTNIEFLDFVNFPLTGQEFADLEHLNHKGARKFSRFFNYLLRNGLLVKSDKQKYIMDEMAKGELIRNIARD